MTRKERSERLSAAWEVIRDGVRVGVVPSISLRGARAQATKFYGAHDDVKRVIIR